MAKILALKTQAPAKFGFERVKRKKQDAESKGQLNLFSPRLSSAKVLNLPAKGTVFEQALLLDEQNDSKAHELYQKAIEIGDCVADAFCNLGIIESRANRTDEAFDCFTRSLREDPRHWESHYNLANLYFEIGTLKLAREHYEIAAKIEPSFANIYFNLGLLLAMSEEIDVAINALSRYKDLVSEQDRHHADDLLDSLKRSQAAPTGPGS